jgi:cytochrome c oxidase subunit 3
MSVVATATTVETGHAHPSVNRPNLTSVGTIIWLSSELMFFAALFAMYFTLRSVTGPDHWKEMASSLNFPFSAANTTILVLSSLTCQLGVFAADWQLIRWSPLWAALIGDPEDVAPSARNLVRARFGLARS